MRERDCFAWICAIECCLLEIVFRMFTFSSLLFCFFFKKKKQNRKGTSYKNEEGSVFVHSRMAKTAVVDLSIFSVSFTLYFPGTDFPPMHTKLTIDCNKECEISLLRSHDFVSQGWGRITNGAAIRDAIMPFLSGIG